MKPRTGDGPLEVTKEGRGIVMRVPLEGGGRLVVELTADEAARRVSGGSDVFPSARQVVSVTAASVRASHPGIDFSCGCSLRVASSAVRNSCITVLPSSVTK